MTRPASSKMTLDDLKAGRARMVPRGRYYEPEWAPKGSQLRIPMPDQGKEGRQ